MTSHSRLYEMLEHFAQLYGSSHTLCALWWQTAAKEGSRHERAELPKLSAGLGFCSPLPEVCSVTLSRFI